MDTSQYIVTGHASDTHVRLVCTICPPEGPDSDYRCIGEWRSVVGFADLNKRAHNHDRQTHQRPNEFAHIDAAVLPARTS